MLFMKTSAFGKRYCFMLAILTYIPHTQLCILASKDISCSSFISSIFMIPSSLMLHFSDFTLNSIAICFLNSAFFIKGSTSLMLLYLMLPSLMFPSLNLHFLKLPSLKLPSLKHSLEHYWNILWNILGTFSSSLLLQTPPD